MIVVPVTDCITDSFIVRDDLLRYRPHRWRVQGHGCLLRTKNQVGVGAAPDGAPPVESLFVAFATGATVATHVP